jgi:hypothetical protein
VLHFTLPLFTGTTKQAMRGIKPYTMLAQTGARALSLQMTPRTATEDAGTMHAQVCVWWLHAAQQREKP